MQENQESKYIDEMIIFLRNNKDTLRTSGGLDRAFSSYKGELGDSAKVAIGDISRGYQGYYKDLHGSQTDRSQLIALLYVLLTQIYGDLDEFENRKKEIGEILNINGELASSEQINTLKTAYAFKVYSLIVGKSTLLTEELKKLSEICQVMGEVNKQMKLGKSLEEIQKLMTPQKKSEVIHGGEVKLEPKEEISEPGFFTKAFEKIKEELAGEEKEPKISEPSGFKHVGHAGQASETPKPVVKEKSKTSTGLGKESSLIAELRKRQADKGASQFNTRDLENTLNHLKDFLSKNIKTLESKDIQEKLKSYSEVMKTLISHHPDQKQEYVNDAKLLFNTILKGSSDESVQSLARLYLKNLQTPPSTPKLQS